MPAKGQVLQIEEGKNNGQDFPRIESAQIAEKVAQPCPVHLESRRIYESAKNQYAAEEKKSVRSMGLILPY